MNLDPAKEIRTSSQTSHSESPNDEPNRFEREYSETELGEKFRAFAKVAGREVVEKALILFHTAKSPRTPRWAKTTIFGALGYFIAPLDAIADFTPVVGYSDDLGVLVAAVAVVLAHVTPEIRKKASDQADEWFGRVAGH